MHISNVNVDYLSSDYKGEKDELFLLMYVTEELFCAHKYQELHIWLSTSFNYNRLVSRSALSQCTARD